MSDESADLADELIAEVGAFVCCFEQTEPENDWEEMEEGGE